MAGRLLPILTVVVLALLPAAARAQEQRALFVGNSYTAANSSNGVDICYRELLKQAVDADAATTRITKGGYTLIQHARDADGSNGDTPLREALVTGEGDAFAWDFVALQEQSQIPGFHPYGSPDWPNSLEGTQILDQLVAAKNARTVMFMTWGRREGDAMNITIFPDFSTMQDLLTSGYELYVSETSTVERTLYLAPVGLAWQRIHDQEDGPLAAESLFWRLYTADGSHPSQLGTYLAGAVFFATLTGRDPTELTWAPAGVDPSDRDRLLAAAREVVVDEPFEPWTFAWGASPRYPWVHAWADYVEVDADGVAIIADPFTRPTVFVRDAAVGPLTELRVGDDVHAGRVALLDGGVLEVDQLTAGPAGLFEMLGGELLAVSVGFALEQAGGTLRVDADEVRVAGDYRQSPAATLEVRTGRLVVDGAALLAGTLDASALAPPAVLVVATSIEMPELQTLLPAEAELELVDAGEGQELHLVSTAEPEPEPEVEAKPDAGPTAEDGSPDQAAASDNAAAEPPAPPDESTPTAGVDSGCRAGRRTTTAPLLLALLGCLAAYCLAPPRFRAVGGCLGRRAKRATSRPARSRSGNASARGLRRSRLAGRARCRCRRR